MISACFLHDCRIVAACLLHAWRPHIAVVSHAWRVPDACPVHACYMSEVYMVQAWCMLVHAWCTFVAYAWCMHAACPVIHAQCMFGDGWFACWLCTWPCRACLVLSWSMPGACTRLGCCILVTCVARVWSGVMQPRCISCACTP